MNPGKFTSLCVGLVLMALASFAYGAPNVATDQAKEVELNKEYRVIDQRPGRIFAQLPNGLLVIVQELHTSPVVSAQVWIKTGSIYEQEHVGAGLSHFLEHLLAGGSTTTRTEGQTNKILGEIGAQTNAATGLDAVHYYINTLSDHASTAVDLLSDWMQHSEIRQEEYERERQVIQREFEHGQGSPERIFWKLTQQARYQVHPARHPTIGYLDEFLKVSRDEIEAFYKRMYVPNNMVFVVVGDVNKEVIANQISELWKQSKPGKLPSISLPIEPKPTHPRSLSGTAAIDQPRLRLAWPGTQLGQAHDYALDLLANILSGGESSRLPRTVRDQEHAVNSISAYNLSFGWGQGFFGVDSTVSVPTGTNADQASRSADMTKALENAKNHILEQIHRVVKEGVDQRELDRARRQQIAGSVFGSQTAQALASQMAGNLLSMGDPDYTEKYNQALATITTQDIQQAAQAILSDSSLMTIALLPEAKGQAPEKLTRPEEPSNLTFKTQPVDLDNQALVARYEKAHAKTAEAHAKPAIEVGPLELHQLKNGLRVIIQRSTLVPAVSLQFYQMGGLLSDEPGREGVANAAAVMVIRGTKSRTAQQIASQLDDLGAVLSPACGNNTFNIQGVSLKADWKQVLGLMADITLHPSFPADEWGNMQRRLLAAIDRQNDSWGNELRNRFREAYYGPSHPWSQSVSGRREVVEALIPQDLANDYYSHLDASQAILAIIGDIDPVQALAQAEKEFSDLPAHAKKPFEAVRAPVPRYGVYEYHTKKPLVAVQIGYGPGPERIDPQFAGMSIWSRVLSDFPSGWLEQELRGKGPGLVYAVGAGQVAGVIPGYFAAMFNTQSTTAVEAIERVAGVFNRARHQLIDEATLNRAKAAVLTNEFFYKQSNGERAADAALNVLYGLGLDEPQRFQAQVKALTSQEVQALAQKYLRQPVIVILSDKPLSPREVGKAAELSSTEPLPVIHFESEAISK